MYVLPYVLDKSRLILGGQSRSSSSSSSGGVVVDDEKGRLREQLSSAILTEGLNVAWSDVAGLDLAKEALEEAVILPRKFPHLFVGSSSGGKRQPWRGILLYGPPGTGKSFLARAVATEADAMFFAVSSSDLVSKWLGESERLVRNLFEMARAEEHAVIFIDEVDSFCSKRVEGEFDSTRRIKTELLVQMQAVHSANGLLVLGATNVPWELDPAFRRRFQKRVYVPLPEAAARTSIVELNLDGTPHTLTQANFGELGLRTEGMSGSDLAFVVQAALMEPLRTCRRATHFRPVVVDGENKLQPPRPSSAAAYPRCPQCPMQDSGSRSNDGAQAPCSRCGSRRMSLYDVPSKELLVPEVSFLDFQNVLCKTRKTVAATELGKFAEWTANFGEEG